MIRMRAPDGMAFFSHQGHPISIDGHGIAMVDERHEADLRTHGFVAVGEQRLAVEVPVPANDAGDPAERSRRGDVIRRLGGLPTETLEMLADVAEGKLKVVTADMAPEPEPVRAPVAAPSVVAVPEVVDAAPVPADGRLAEAQIDAMTKPQLVAWLKKREIPALPPIDLDELRAKVKHFNAAA